MTLSDHENPPNYTGMLVGGWSATAAGGLGLPIILTVGIMSKATIPTGFAALVMGAIIVGTILLVGRLILRRLDEHKADHQRSAVDLDDIVTIRQQVADILAFIARWDVERAEERKMVTQIEAFLGWLERAKQRARDENASRSDMTPAQRDTAWMNDMAEAMEIGREIERRRPPEEH